MAVTASVAGLDQISQLMGEKAQPLGERLLVLLARQAIALVRELGDRVGDGIVQAAVEGAELVDLDRQVALEREVGDRLAQVAVVVHHLVDREAVPQELQPVARGRGADFGGRVAAATRRA